MIKLSTLKARRLGACFTLSLSLWLGACATTSPTLTVSASDASHPPVQPAQTSAPDLPRGDLSPLNPVEVTPTPVVALAAPADLWERLRRGFGMPDLDTELVRERVQWYRARPGALRNMTERSRKYLFHIVEEVERRGLPMELALLPYVESAFNPQAVSHAKAAGMWQFMPATGQSFDLKQNIFRDDRRDVLASTRAALDYLEQLHARFGDWHLALAAYNWGQGNLGRAIARNQREGLSAGYTDLAMPQETRQYVPKLLALKTLIADPGAHGLELAPIGNHPFFDTVTLERDMDVALIAELAGVSEADFRTLNPSLRKPVVMAAVTPQILLPWDHAVRFEQALAFHSGPLATWTAWVVPHTMTPAQIAQKMGWSEARLREVNQIPPRMRVQAGSSLLVPRQARHADVPEQVADNARLLLAPEPVARRSTVKVARGDTLARLASRHGVTVAQLASWNRLSPTASLKAGQTLRLAPPAAAPSRSAGPKSAPTRVAAARP